VTEYEHALVLSTSPLPSGATQIADQCTKYGPYSGTVGRSLPASPNPYSIRLRLIRIWRRIPGSSAGISCALVGVEWSEPFIDISFYLVFRSPPARRKDQPKRIQRRETAAAVGVARASHTPDMPDERCVRPRSAKLGPCWEQYPIIEFFVRYKRYYSVLTS
jgi:hypothetical protein